MKIQFWHKRSWNFVQDFYLPLKENFPEIEWIFPHITPDTQVISEESLEWVDIFLAEVSDSATGLGIELGLARAYGKRIICMHRSNAGVVKSIKYITEETFEYSTKDDMIETLKAVL